MPIHSPAPKGRRMGATIPRLVTRWGYALLLGGALSASWTLAALGAPIWLHVTAVVAVAGALVWLWEWRLPHTEAWRVSRRRLRLDITHTLLSSGAVSRLVELGLLSTIAAMAPFWATDGALWPGHWPLLLQLAVAMLLGEFGAYWAHRLCHLTALGWRIHAVHHSSEALHLWASGRTHPFNTALVFTGQTAGILLLGAPAEVISLMAVFTGVNGLLQHANIQVSPGPLNWVISTTEHHRWHHSRVLDESNTNFGNNLIVWDRVFGTHFAPAERASNDAVGLTGAALPESLLGHWLTPFLLHRYADHEEDR